MLVSGLPFCKVPTIIYFCDDLPLSWDVTSNNIAFYLYSAFDKIVSTIDDIEARGLRTAPDDFSGPPDRLPTGPLLYHGNIWFLSGQLANTPVSAI